MADRDRANRVNVERIDWPSVLPGLHLFQSFRMAIQPAKLVLGLALIVAIVLGGRGLDLIWGNAVQPGEWQQYVSESWPALIPWAEALDPPAANNGQPGAVFDTALRLQTTAFGDLIRAATGINVDASTTALPGGAWWETAWAALIMLAVVPAWLASHHPIFLVVFAIGKLILVALLGGALARLAAVEACRDLRASVNEGLRFAGGRYPWFVMAPLIPLGVVLIVVLLLAVAGGALFNLPVTDVVGALILPLLLIGGFVITLILIGLAVGVHLLYPGIAVEGSDAFDAISRAFNYIFGRPWRYLLYTAVILVYGLITFLFFAALVYLTLAATHWAAGLWAGAEMAGDRRFDAILPMPAFNELLRPAAWWGGRGTGSAGVAAWIASVWIKLLVGLLPAYLISYYFSAHTWLYLLLRRAADGTEFDDLYLEETPNTQAATTPSPDASSNQPSISDTTSQSG